jgi:hypothetical protein
MAKLTGQQLVDRLCARMGYAATPTSQQRAAALVLLQEAENWIAQQGSFKHLERETTLTLADTRDYVDIPSWVDFGKTMSLGLPNGNGEVRILPADQFRRDRAYTFGAWNQTSPTSCHVALDATGATQRFIFDRANTTGGSLVYPFSAQQLPNTIADTNGANSGSSLPEGYETSILLKRAELEGKREVRAIVSEAERDDLMTQMGHFFDQYRSSKENPKPDSEQQARKLSEQIAEGR